MTSVDFLEINFQEARTVEARVLVLYHTGIRLVKEYGETLEILSVCSAAALETACFPRADSKSATVTTRPLVKFKAQFADYTITKYKSQTYEGLRENSNTMREYYFSVTTKMKRK